MRHPALRPSRYALPLLALVLAASIAACSGISSRQAPTKPPPAPVVQAPAPAEPLAPAPAPVPTVTAEPAPALAPPPPKPYATAALLLPLTGQAAMTGADLLNAAQLALFEVADAKFTLLPYDTKGTAEGAVAALRQALVNSPDIIVGPLFAAEVRAAAPLARDAHVPMIALSSDYTVAGDGIYTLGFLPGPQASRVVDFAARHGHRRVAVLAPDNEYGKRVAEQIASKADRLGAVVVGEQYYDDSASDLATPIKRLVKFDASLPGDPGFDALLLPDTGARLRQVAASLPLLGVDPVRVKLLGTMVWDDANPGSESTLAGGWYPAPPSANHQAFLDRYAKAFGSKPAGIASLAYDATALAAVLAKATPRDFAATALTNPAGFAGVDGLFRLLADGTAERGYAIDQVVPGGASTEIDRAPTAFGGSGS